MIQATTPARTSDDACPGALRPHHAADGELIRLRVPGGALAPAGLRALADVSRRFGDGRVGLTSRANLQVRGVAADDVAAVVEALRAAGLVPAPEHERVRNILASPLSGRGPGSRRDVDPLVRALDAELCARADLSRLPGRFLFGLDDGGADITGEGPDVLARPGDEGRGAGGADGYAVCVAGADGEVRVHRDQVARTMVAAAAAFLAERTARGSRAWRIGELDGGGAAVSGRMAGAGWRFEAARPESSPPGSSPDGGTALRPGLHEQTDQRFAVCALAPLGRLEGEHLAALAAAAELSDDDDAFRITPWRRVVVRDLELPRALAARELLAAVGLVTTPESAWARVTACAGRPGCAKSLTDVHSDARIFAETAAVEGPAVHWAGCERGCGTPSGRSVVRMLATPGGYHEVGPR